MCTGLEIAALAAAAAGTVTSTVGAIQQGKSAQNLANYNAQIAQNDAIAARQKAEFDARAQERQARLFAGTQRASMAATGGELLDMQDVVDMSAEEAELENLAIRYGGDMGYRAGQQRATVARMEGAAAKQKATGQAVGSLLTGASSAASMGAKYSK
tara:strand:+ start:182 stop:652 length:471 start_codon:yes stop_codon:yes gene_type:complete